MKPIALISTGNAGADYTSTQMDLGDILNLSIQVTFSSATLNGSLKLQSSNDNTNYTDVTGSTQAIVSGASHMWSVVNATYRYIRVVWTWTSGTGTLSSNALIKETFIRGA